MGSTSRTPFRTAYCGLRRGRQSGRRRGRRHSLQGWRPGQLAPVFAVDRRAREAQRTCLPARRPAARRLGRIHDLHEAVPVPDALSEVEASTLPIAALAAWFALVEVGSLKPDQVILTQGTGGVSIFAAQSAQASGAK